MHIRPYDHHHVNDQASSIHQKEEGVSAFGAHGGMSVGRRVWRGGVAWWRFVMICGGVGCGTIVICGQVGRRVSTRHSVRLDKFWHRALHSHTLVHSPTSLCSSVHSPSSQPLKMRAALLRTARFARPRAPNSAPPASAYFGRTISNYSQRLRSLEEEDIGQTDAVSKASVKMGLGGNSKRGDKSKGNKQRGKGQDVEQMWDGPRAQRVNAF
jgi:hypothetical protein